MNTSAPELVVCMWPLHDNPAEHHGNDLSTIDDKLQGPPSSHLHLVHYHRTETAELSLWWFTTPD